MTRKEYDLLPGELPVDPEVGFRYAPESLRVKAPEVGYPVVMLRVSAVDGSGPFREITIVIESDEISD